MSTCFHCGLPALDDFSVSLQGEQRDFCCLGCQLVSQTIVAGGLDQFYQYRDTYNTKAEEVTTSFSAYDLQEVQKGFVEHLENNTSRASLIISNISCAACAWLIENFLSALPGVKSVNVNVALHRCTVDFISDKTALHNIQLSKIFSELHKIGYQAIPYTPSTVAEQRKKEERNALMRLGVAGLGMMQVGMVAIALHAGDIQGMDLHWQHYLRWVSLIVATPVILFSARPFFAGAWRALKLGHLNMDVPVSIALLLAYGASLWATVNNSGQVYFDSVSMFTFFLLAGRFLEMRVRHSSAFAAERLSQLLPLTADLVEENAISNVPLSAIKQGDILRVSAGEVFPCDAMVVEGQSSADESLLTGEAMPQPKVVGDRVLAGSINGESALRIKVCFLGGETQLAQVEKLVDQASARKPKLVALADKYSSVFVAVVLVVASIVGATWYFIDASKAFWVTLSVLVVTCPCALSLATPTALTAGILRMRKIGVLITEHQFLEKLPDVNQIVFDKTGTLTYGKLKIQQTIVLSDVSEQCVTETIAALEASSRHPIALAFQNIKTSVVAKNVVVHATDGVQGYIDEQEYKFGKKEFSTKKLIDYPSEGLWQLLSKNGVPLAWVLLVDKPREDIVEALTQLSELQIQYQLLSGDRCENVKQFIEQYPIPIHMSSASPQEKLQYIEKLQARGEKVLMVGDGINDVPVLSGADMSLAMNSATRLAQTHADAVMLSEGLVTIPQAILLARRVKKTIQQNLLWAIVYNALALPAAAAGLVPPYIAAIGMSASSLIVVVNAWRLRSVTI